LKRTLSLPVLPTSLKLPRTGLSLGVVGILLCASALNAGPVLSVLDPYPSEMKIEAIATFKRQYYTDQLVERDYTGYLYLEKSFFSLKQPTEVFKQLASYKSDLYATALALQNVTRSGINVECTTTHKEDSTKKHVWQLTIPLNQDFNETKELDLLDDAGEKISVTIKSTVTQ
jgi:hypothetical protein